MEQDKINNFKERLTKELEEVDAELNTIGRESGVPVKNTPVDWEAKPADFDTDTADPSESADKIEEFEENTAVLKNLEIRFNEIKKALEKIEAGKYGLCEVCGKEIELDRLEANPAAKTCKEHMDS